MQLGNAFKMQIKCKENKSRICACAKKWSCKSRASLDNSQSEPEAPLADGDAYNIRVPWSWQENLHPDASHLIPHPRGPRKRQASLWGATELCFEAALNHVGTDSSFSLRMLPRKSQMPLLWLMIWWFQVILVFQPGLLWTGHLGRRFFGLQTQTRAGGVLELSIESSIGSTCGGWRPRNCGGCKRRAYCGRNLKDRFRRGRAMTSESEEWGAVRHRGESPDTVNAHCLIFLKQKRQNVYPFATGTLDTSTLQVFRK